MSPRKKPVTTLWGGPAGVDQAVFDYTAGPDRPWDARLLRWDILGSLGHAEGLYASSLLSLTDYRRLQRGLRSALREAERGRLRLGRRDEDVHTLVEGWLTRKAGEAGQRLHTGRSRNDQIACDIRLYLKDALLRLHERTAALTEVLLAFARRERASLWPGYTHLRRAMPSSAGAWAAGYAEGLLDTLEQLPAVYQQADRSPLGSAAGYGVPLPIRREAAARALGFARLELSVTAVQNGRGKLEAAALFWCAQLAADLGKLAADVILLSSEEYGFLELPADLATGSSIMPQKRNPDLFELTRARSALVDGDLAAVLALRGRLTGGYHRDFQFLKEPLVRGLDRTADMLAMLGYAVPRLTVNRKRAREALTGGVLATDLVMQRVEEGEPFRAAYQDVARAVRAGEVPPPLPAADLLRRRRSAGGLGNLGLDVLARRLRAFRRWERAEQRRFVRAMARLAGGRR